MLLAQGVVQPSIDWHAIAPELVLTVTACLVLVVDLFLSARRRWLAMPLSVAGILATGAAVISLTGKDRTTLAGTFEIEPFALLFKGLFCVIGLVLLAISFHHMRTGRYFQGEYYFLLLCSLLGGLVMASARDLITIFIAIELISLPGIIMTGLRKRDVRSNEAALKFFLFSVLSSAVMLYGMSLVFGATGETELSAIRDSIAQDANQPLIALSVLFVIAGFAFKISAVPFHFWAPDTYEGAPSPVAAFLSTASKIGGFVGLLVLMFRAFPEVAETWRPAFAVLAVLTMTVGNLIALRQRHIIRLLAYSGIAQSGYILVAFALIDPSNPQINAQAFEAAVVYLAIYAVMDLGAFAAAVAYADRGGTYFIDDYAGLWNRNPGLALAMAGFLLSLAGAPPMAGVWAKVFIFFAAVNAEVYWLAAAVAINAVIAAFYYLAVVKRMFMDTADVTEPFEIPYLMRIAMGAAVLVLVAGCFYPGFLTNLTEGSIL